MANRQISENYEMKTDEEYKQIGNDLFKQNKLNEALEQYLEAIKINPENGCVYSNIALVYIRLEKYGQAVIEATKSVKFGYNKGYYRRASAYLAMANFDKAAKDFRIASKLFPSNFGIKNKLAFCNAEIRKAIFTDSIKNENNIPLSERLDLDKFVVPDDFSGLKLNFPLNRETVLEIKSNLKQQKRIHIRFVYQIILKTIEILKSEQNLVKSSIPKEAKFNVCGDVHGQFYDLVNIFEIFGEPSKNNIFLFNGDVVDRFLKMLIFLRRKIKIWLLKIKNDVK
ncbi:hypothetical protein MHBO_000625 [Bonamia ostreae]|uniref:protein-serine/threonine phosphatase n=1 Tax=Bonamia ostreae TaxID=126728 RepID=A0ABV2AGB1_9EUKA